MADRHISILRPFAMGYPIEWFQKFEICSKANRWDAAKMTIKLPTLLEGEALAIWLELSDEEQGTYDTAKENLMTKMTPAGFISLNEFHQWKAQPVYLHELKRLLDRAMTKLEKKARDQLLLHQFLDGLPVSVSTQLRATGDTKVLQDTVEWVRVLMTINSDRSHSTKDRGSTTVEGTSLRTNKTCCCIAREKVQPKTTKDKPLFLL